MKHLRETLAETLSICPSLAKTSLPHSGAGISTHLRSLRRLTVLLWRLALYCFTLPAFSDPPKANRLVLEEGRAMVSDRPLDSRSDEAFCLQSGDPKRGQTIVDEPFQPGEVLNSGRSGLSIRS